jgi:hypothetical protein
MVGWIKKGGLGLLFAVAVGGIFSIGLGPRYKNVQNEQQLRFWSWIIIMLLVLLIILVAGKALTKVWKGAFVDDRNMASLSRFQLIAWTVLILSAFTEAALSNIRLHAHSPLAIAIPAQIWALLGISTTSLIGSPLILDAKKKRRANLNQAETTLKNRVDARHRDDSISNVGQVVTNSNKKDASWGDLFRGEEVSNADGLDIGKMQMFFFTLLLIVAYAAGLADIFLHGTGAITKFPILDTSMIALLGISHAGYLANKASNRGGSTTAPPAGGPTKVTVDSDGNAVRS